MQPTARKPRPPERRESALECATTLHTACDQFFRHKGCREVIGSSPRLDEEGERIVCDLHYVTEHNKGEAAGREFPFLLTHDATLEKGLDILFGRLVKPGPGMCGHGVYGFLLKSLETDDVLRMLERCKSVGDD